MLDFFATSFDLPILEWIQTYLQCAFMDFIMPIITIFGDAGIFWIACAVILIFIPKYRKVGLSMGVALLMGVLICNVMMKPLIGRIRPYDFQIQNLGKTWNDIIEGGKLLVNTPHDFSFPSGHTIASFEASVVLMLNDKRLGIPALVLACLIAFSRMYLYVHYPTDVIASIILGTAFAFIGNWLVHKLWEKIPVRKGKYEA